MRSWLDYFDLVICGARKPGFLLDPYLPLFQVQVDDASLVNTEMGTAANAARALAAGKVFQGGNWNHLHRMLRLRTGSQLLYVGDHMYSDILRSKRTLGWRTVLIVPELFDEVVSLEETEEHRHQMQLLRATRSAVDRQLLRVQLRRLELVQGGATEEDLAPLDEELERVASEQRALSETLATALVENHEGFHPQWGQLFKAGHQNSRWAQQVQDYACLYTSHATNLLFSSSGTSTFRALTDLMPHDRAVAHIADLAVDDDGATEIDAH